MAISVVQNVEKVRGFFVTAIAGAQVQIAARGDLVSSPATHYADEAGTGPSTAIITADESGQVITYLDAGSFDFFFRSNANADWEGPIPVEVAGGSVDPEALRLLTFVETASSFTGSEQEWQADFSFVAGTKTVALITGYVVNVGAATILDSDLHPESQRDVLVMGIDGGTPGVFAATVGTDGEIAIVGGTPEQISYNFTYQVEDS